MKKEGATSKGSRLERAMSASSAPPESSKGNAREALAEAPADGCYVGLLYTDMTVLSM